MPPKRRNHPTSEADSAPKPSKRARFAAGPAPVEDEDASRFEAEVDAALDEDIGGKRGKRVKVDGYASDSTDDGEGVVYSRRKGEEEDDDMFAAGDDDAAGAGGKGSGKKETKYLAMGEIEGQEFDVADGTGNEDGSVSSNDPEDEDDAIRKSKEGMGYQLSKFNMKEEMEEGKFVEDGSFVRSFDAHAVHDKWLEDVGEREMKKARRAKRNAEKREKERIREEEKSGITVAIGEGKTRMEMELVGYLQPSESVIDALARLGKEKKKKAQKSAGVAKTSDVKAKAPDIDRITALASALLVHDAEVYSTTFEAHVRSIRRSGVVPAEWNPPVTAYEYRWADNVGAPDTKGAVYGPFSALEMRTWYDASFFGFSGEKILLRKVKDGMADEWAEWGDVFA
jgi:CD2 antigen cytoplasmic tail-binding protein 2